MLEFQNAESSRKLYSLKKENIISLLDKTIDFYTNVSDENKIDAFKKLKEDLVNGEFSIVVVGEFSAGKSTLLNALMGNRILPSFSNETTATVNFLRHSEKATEGVAGKVFYRDGAVKELSEVNLDVINQYVSTKGKDVASDIEHLDLYLNSNFLLDGVTLVDSPGLNGVADGHREITEHQILKSHASIFLFNSDHPGSKTDFEFLNDLQKKVKTIIFVLNKIDNIKEDEGETVESVIESLKASYKKQFPDATSVPEIWPVAAYDALQARINKNQELEEKSRLEAFENRLLSFLTCGEKAHQQLLTPIEKVIALVKETREEYDDELKVLNNSVGYEEIENQIESIQETLDGLSTRIGESRKSVDKNISLALDEVYESLNAKMERFRERKLHEIKSFDNPNELSNYVDSFERKYLESVKLYTLSAEEELREKIITAIKLQYICDAEKIEENINEGKSNIKLTINSKINEDVGVYEVGLKELDEKSKKLQEEYDRLLVASNKSEDESDEQQERMEKRKSIEEKIETLKERKLAIQEQTLPIVQRYNKPVVIHERRRGILGGLLNILVGDKTYSSNEIVEDDSDRRQKKSEIELQTAEIEKEINEAKVLLEQYPECSPLIAKKLHRRDLENLQIAGRKLEEHEKEVALKVSNLHAKAVKRCVSELGYYCESVSDELMHQVKKGLREAKSDYVDMVLSVVESNLRTEIDSKKNKILRLQEQKKTSEENREQKIADIEQNIQAIDCILEMAIDMQVDLESEKIDRIENISI